MTLKLSEGRVKSYNVALAAMQLSLCRGESGGMVQVSHVGWVVKISQSVTAPVRIYKSLAFFKLTLCKVIKCLLCPIYYIALRMRVRLASAFSFTNSLALILSRDSTFSRILAQPQPQP